MYVDRIKLEGFTATHEVLRILLPIKYASALWVGANANIWS